MSIAPFQTAFGQSLDQSTHVSWSDTPVTMWIGKKINLQELSDLAIFLKATPEATQLHLSSCNIDHQGAKILAGALEHLDTLCLEGNPIGSRGMKAIARSISSHQFLRTLTLRSCRTEDMKDQSGMQVLAEALYSNKSLTNFSSHYNKIDGQAMCVLATAFQTNALLVRVSLDSSHLGDAGASILAAGLAGMSIRGLSLEMNDIGDLGARELANALAQNTSLAFLSLRDNLIGDPGATNLADSLYKNRSLAFLSLKHNKVGRSGIRAFCAALQVNTSLVGIKLYGSPWVNHLFTSHDDFGPEVIKIPEMMVALEGNAKMADNRNVTLSRLCAKKLFRNIKETRA